MTPAGSTVHIGPGGAGADPPAPVAAGTDPGVDEIGSPRCPPHRCRGGMERHRVHRPGHRCRGDHVAPGPRRRVFSWFGIAYVLRWTTWVDRRLAGWQRGEKVPAVYRRPTSRRFPAALTTLSRGSTDLEGPGLARGDVDPRLHHRCGRDGGRRAGHDLRADAAVVLGGRGSARARRDHRPRTVHCGHPGRAPG